MAGRLTIRQWRPLTLVGLCCSMALLLTPANPPALIAAGASAVVTDALASAPLIAYQGRLLDPATGQPKADGAYTMLFSLYDVASGGATLWSESKSVTVSKGLFSTLLGEVTALALAVFDGRDLYLGVTIGADPEATPRQRLAYSAYAIYARNADLIDGQEASAFSAASHNHDDRYFTEAEDDTRFLNSAGPDTMTGNSTGVVLQVNQTGGGDGLQGVTAASTPGRAGIFGVAGTLTGVSTPAQPAGVLGKSAEYFGVVGYSRADDGVYGRSELEYGVRAEGGGTKAALFALANGSATTSYAIQAQSSATHGVYADGAVYGFYTPDKIFAGSGYSDLAEHIPAAADVAAGDVVVIDPDSDERVIKSSRANDPTVAGVISTDPAMLIGDADSPSPLALAGRVPVKVSAENGAIHRGDLLTTSNTPGHAMRATPVLVNGVPFYTPGAIIGKALGELEQGVGVIIVLVSPQ